jgi:uncharacterized sulfatase
VELVDLYPTVAEYCGTSVPHALAGESLKPLLENPEATGKAAAFTLVARGGGQYGQAVRTKRWRYVQWSDGSQELYDELSDPQEVHDLSDEPAQANVIKELKREIARIGPFQASDAKRAKQK